MAPAMAAAPEAGPVKVRGLETRKSTLHTKILVESISDSIWLNSELNYYISTKFREWFK